MSGRLCPGGVDVALTWRGQLELDVAPLLPEGMPVWLRADNAYYRGKVVEFCRERGWDYSISLTDDRKRGSVLDQIEGLRESAWEDIGMREDATFATHRPRGWEEEHYVVVRRKREGGQKLLIPAYTVILVSRGDAARGAGAPAPGEAGAGECVQGAAGGTRPAPSSVPGLQGEPGVLRLRAGRADAAGGGAVRIAAEKGAAPWTATTDPVSGPRRGEAGADGQAMEAVLREEQLPPWLYRCATQLE